MDPWLVSLWCHVLLLLTRLMTSSGYAPDETECPDRLHRGIMSRDYWVPYGVPYRAWRTLPWRYFVLKTSSIPDAGLGVFATTFIPKNTWLGEYEGDIIPMAAGEQSTLDYAWGGYIDGQEVFYVDAAYDDTSNWLRFVNCPNHESDENVSSHFCYGRIYYRTKRDILPGQELLTYYGDVFAEHLGILDDYYNK